MEDFTQAEIISSNKAREKYELSKRPRYYYLSDWARDKEQKSAEK